MKKNKTKLASPTLRFSPTAWAKLLFLRDCGDTEVGGFGVAAEDDLLYVEDFVLVKQSCTPVSVCFEDESVADYFDLQADLGRPPEQCARIWLHTHPGRSPAPSTTDEETFARVFGECEWAVMFIIAEYGETYARLAFHSGPGGSLKVPVEVNFQPPFAASDEEAWHREYQENVFRQEPLRMFPGEPGRLLGAAERGDREHYAGTLFAQRDAERGNCTSRSTMCFAVPWAFDPGPRTARDAGRGGRATRSAGREPCRGRAALSGAGGVAGIPPGGPL